jgi:hypothetical protein
VGVKTTTSVTQVDRWFIWEHSGKWVVTHWNPNRESLPHLLPYQRRYDTQEIALEAARLLEDEC